MRDLTGSGFGVQALRVTSLAVLEWSVTEHLEEVAPGLGVHPARQLAVFGQRADGRDQHDLAGIGEQRRHMCQSPQVLGAIGHGKPEVGVEPVP